ncbi:MAG: hypothetical protein KKC46_01800 [Proteobacteria bacterium]|nr:hypothetical protein [Pseudomonadota bacterium]
MQDKEEIIRTLSDHYIAKVMRAFGNVDPASKALEVVAKSLNEIYRYFEPSFFKGDFFVCKDLNDQPCFDESKGALLYDKNILLNRTGGLLIIQVFTDSSKMIIWEDQDPDELFKQTKTLIYHFNNNKEYFFANGSKIDITIYNKGSRFATQFNDLVQALCHYSKSKILKSTCKHFSDSWADTKRLFFKGGGSGSNIPEKFMQLSLHEFLSTFFARGISMESSREYNVVGDLSKPKPVDIKIQWREANRTALIEIKFIGTVKKEADGEIYTHGDPRANQGIAQLKEYFDTASSDAPTTILKSYLVVIDGRRNNLTPDKTTINTADGMCYKDIDIVINEDKKFHESILGFEKPIRMFAEPVCS